MADDSQPIRTFIRIVEVWLPTDDGQLLELDDGMFGGVAGFEAMTRMMAFSPDEGLPGRTWASGAPMLIRPIEGGVFRRSRAVRLAGLQCTIAMPVYRAQRITSIVVMLFGESAPERGAVELWIDDPVQPDGPALSESHYGTTEDELEAKTRGTRSRFHAVTDQPAALRLLDQGCALGLPCSAPDGRAWMLDLFASNALPLARRIETWTLEEAADGMARTVGWCSKQGVLVTGTESVCDAGLLGPIDRARRTGVAWAGPIRRDGVARKIKVDAVFPFDHALVIPTSRDSGTDVVVLHF